MKNKNISFERLRSIFSVKKTEDLKKGLSDKANDNDEIFNSIIEKIIESYKDKSRVDIRKWRNALLMAENLDTPRFDFLHNIYSELVIDAEFQNVIELRKTSSLNTEFFIYNEKQEVDIEKTNLFKQEWFYDFIGDIIDSIVYGYTFIEFIRFGSKIEYVLLPRKNILPKEKAIILDLSSPENITYLDVPTYQNRIISIINRDYFGKLNSVVPNLIWQRNTMQSWAEFCERFGIPMITAETTKLGTKESEEVMTMLERLGESIYGTFPQGTNLQIHEANRSDAYQSFLNFIKINNENIAKIFVGGTMINSNGSSRSQSEVHERNLDEKISISDKRLIEFVVNDKLIPLLRNNGYDFSDNDRFTFDMNQNISIKDHWNIVSDILNHYEVEEDWIEKTFQIPIKGKKQITENNVTANFSIPNNIESDIIREDKIIENLYGSTCGNCNIEMNDEKELQESFKDIDKVFEKELLKIYNKQKTKNEVAKLTSEILIKAIERGYGKSMYSIDYESPDYSTLQELTNNIYQFSFAKNYQQLKEVNNLLKDKEGKIKSYSEFKEDALKINDKYNKNYLRTEYNHAIASSMSVARWKETPKEAMLEYITAGDNKVRSEHQLLNGIKKRKEDKFWDTYYPPNGWGCRCHAVETNSTKETETNNEKLELLKQTINKDFRNNPAITLKIFPQEHPFFKGIPKEELDSYYTKRIEAIYGIEKIEEGIYKSHLHGKNEFKQNLVDAKTLKSFGYDVLLLPVFEVSDDLKKEKFNNYLKNLGWDIPKGMESIKNPDFAIRKNKEMFIIDGKNASSTTSIDNHLKKVKEQAEYVLFSFSNKIEKEDILRTINERNIRHGLGDLKEVWFENKGKLEKIKIKKPKNKS